MALKNNFSFLIAGQSVANIGDILYIVSIINFVFLLTGSAAVASVVPFTITSAMFVSSVLTPLLIERVRLNRLLAGSQILKTLLVVLFCLVLPMLNTSNFFLIFFLIALIALCDGCANPVSQALIPHYVESDRLVKANGIFESVYQTINTVMWLAGGTFLLFMSSGQLLWAVAVLFLISSILLSLLSKVNHQTDMEPKKKSQQLKEGWIKIIKTPVLKRIVLLELLETMAGTVWIAAILYIYVSEVLNVGQQWWGFINGTFFTGLILGGLFFVKFDQYANRHLAKVILIGLLSGAVATVLFSITTIPIVALILSLIVGLATQMVGIPKQTIIQTSVPEGKLVNVYSSLGALGTATFGISSLLIGITADWLGIKMVFFISAIWLVIAAVVVFFGRRLFVRNFS